MINLTNIKERISYYIEIKNIVISDFHRQTGVSYGILWQKSKMTEDNIVKILTTYRDINMNWLILGEGPMLKADIIEESVEDTEKVEQILELIRKHSENLIAEIRSLTQKAPKPYPEPPMPLNMVAED